MQEYIREITLSQMVKAITINIKTLFIIMFTLGIIIIFISLAINKYHEQVFTTTGAIQINNYAANTYADQQIVMTNNKTEEIPNSSIATRSEIEEALIKAGYILMPVIKKNHLDIKLTPVTLPIVGRMINSICGGIDENSKLMFGYCHGKVTEFDIVQFDVGDKELNKNFILKITSPSSYELYKNNTYVLSGRIGQISSSNGVTLQINSINSKVQSKFILSKLSMDKAIADLSQHIMIEPVIVGKNFVPPITGILKISMSGDRPKLQATVVNDIIDQLKKTALAQQGNVLTSSINFIEKQIAQVSQQLKTSQANMVSFQASNNVISLDNQERQYIQRLSDVEQSILENKIAINQFSTLYASKHPVMLDLYTQRDYLISKKSALDAQLNKIPKAEAIYLNLKRNLDVYQQLYSYLLNKEQELKMKQSSLFSPVDILYYASPNVAANPVNVSAKLIAVILTIIFFIIIVVFINFVLFSNTDPWLMSELSKIPLLAVFPYIHHSKHNRSIELTASYLLHKVVNKTLVVNISNISHYSGKTYIINGLIKCLNKLNKKCLYLNLCLNDDLITVTELIQKLEQQEQITLNSNSELKINQLSAMDNIQMQKLISSLSNFDFIFLESPSTEDSPLFLHLSQIADESLLIVSPKDTRNKLEWLINDIINLNANITQIIYNNPKKTIIKSLYAVESFHK